MEGHEAHLHPGWEKFVEETPPDITYEHREFLAHIYPGSPDGESGATLWWTDYVINEWAEHFTDMAIAVARLATLIRGVETEAFFKDGPAGFVRWGENLFNQSLTPLPKPTGRPPE